MADEDRVDPLPRDWLPSSPVRAARDVEYWDAQARSVAAAAEPTLARYRAYPQGRLPWWHALGRSWRPALAGALAAAAGLLLALGLGADRRPAPHAGDVALAAVASAGEPAALWAARGEEADPILAFLALETELREEGGTR